MASFYDTIGRKDEADEAWLRVLTSGSDAFVYCAIGRFYADHTSEQTLHRIEQLETDSPMILVAKAYVLAGVPGKRSEARHIYDMLSEQSTSLVMRQAIIKILLLLGETDEAIRQCREWLSQHQRQIDTGHEMRTVGSDETVLEVIAEAGGERPSEGINASLTRQFNSEYARGLLALSNGDTSRALEHLKACEAVGHVRSDVQWVIAFRRRIDPDWPKGNRGLHSNILQDDTAVDAK